MPARIRRKPFKVVNRARWLQALGDPRATLTLSHFGYSDHAAHAVPVLGRVLDVHLLWFVVDQRYSGRVRGKRVQLEAGTFSWITPGTPHDFVIPRGLTTYHLRVRLTHEGRDLSLKGGQLLARNAWELRTPLEQLLAELQLEMPYGEMRKRQLVGEIATRAFRRMESSPAADNRLSGMQRFRLQQRVAERIRDGLTPRELAEALDLSHDYFTRLFRKSYGMAPRAWLMRERIRVAEALLSEGRMNITETAAACGFYDPNLFSRQFKQVYGCSPRQYLKTRRR